MKKIILFFALLTISSLSIAQLSPRTDVLRKLHEKLSFSTSNLSHKALEIRNQLAQYAQSQGMSISYSGDLLIIERDSVFYTVYFYNENPINVEIHYAETNIVGCLPNVLMKAVNYVNFMQSAVKVTIVPDFKNLRISTEFIAKDAQYVTNTLTDNMDAIQQTWDMINDKYIEYYDNQSFEKLRLPCESYSALVANVDLNNTIITPLNTPIKSSDTQYLNTRLSLIVYQEGTHTLSVKFYTPDGNLSKAEDDDSPYTFSTTIQLSKDNNMYYTGGWGSTTPGTWGAGKYHLEYYLDDQLFYIKNVDIIE